MLTLKELKKLNTKRLLDYYKAERKRFNIAGYFFSCDYDDITAVSFPDSKDADESCVLHKMHLDMIKAELNAREHVDDESKNK